MANGNPNYQQMYKPTLSGQMKLTTPYPYYPGMGHQYGYMRYGLAGAGPEPVYQEFPWESHFTAEGKPLYETTGQTLSDLLERQRKMQEAGGLAGGELSQQIAGLQKKYAQEKSAFEGASQQYNLFPYQAHYTAEGVPIHEQTSQSLQDLINKKNALTAAGGYYGQYDQQIATMQKQAEDQRAALNRAQAIYQAGGQSAWDQMVKDYYKRFDYKDYGGNGGG